MRQQIPTNTPSITERVEWDSPNGQTHKILATYQIVNGKVVGVFCGSLHKAGTEMVAMMNDAMILASRLLQHGESIDDLAAAMGENSRSSWDDMKKEGKAGPPASLIGAILRAGIHVENDALTGALG